MADTPSPLSPRADGTPEASPGGGFEGDPDEACVAIYPGPAGSLAHFCELVDGKPELIPVSEFVRWSSTAAFPLVPSRPAFRVWRKIKQNPRFDGADLPSERAEDLSLSLSLESSGGGDFDRSRETSTQPSTGTGSAETMENPSGRRVSCHPRPGSIRERRWGFRPVREFDATRDRGWFVNDDGGKAQAEADCLTLVTVWPVYKGESFDLWQPDTSKFYDSADVESVVAHLQTKRLAQSKTRRSAFAQQDEATINDSTTLPCLHPRIAFRDVTNPTNTRTIVVALVPGNRVIVHSAPYLLLVEGTVVDEAYVLGVLCSMICDWQARRTVELHITFEQLNALSIPDPGAGHPVRDRVANIAGRLAATDERFDQWAAQVGVPVGSVTDEATKQDLLAELDACVAHLYGLDEADLGVIYDTFSRTVDYSDRHAAVIDHFRRIL
ncbi:hypothetical protein [Candidatus Poriferisocius sp.]|uniref:hypothetical protein n=1 Tax=Candidatus Poriferisocius sp. TaxID=3101276 RepID=UPI003B026855